MPAERGPDKGAQPRTLRGEALEKGADPRGFDAGVTTPDPQAGTPSDQTGGHYVDKNGQPGATPDAPLPRSSPFKIGQ